MSRLSSILYSIFIAPHKRYSASRFEGGYFQRYRELTERDKQDYYDRAAAYLNLISPHATVLDVGCGTGLLLEGFLKKEIDARGIEISSEAIAAAAPSTRPRIQRGGLPHTGFQNRAFDLVLCIDVLEHLPPEETDRAILELARITRHHLVLSICLWHEGNARKDPTHINLHSKRYWRNKIGTLGFSTKPLPDGFPSGSNSFLISVE
jgi:SAM-dependent methyltransferase